MIGENDIGCWSKACNSNLYKLSVVRRGGIAMHLWHLELFRIMARQGVFFAGDSLPGKDQEMQEGPAEGGVRPLV